MNKETIELFTKNYEGKGLCEKLEEHLKEFKKGALISYLPWAVVERIFRLQGGVITIENLNFTIENETKTGELDGDGVYVEKKEVKKALFVHLRATWMGETLEEYYPIINNKNEPVGNPNNMHYNNAKQRGMVKLIARISGIGLMLFEKGDLQFEESLEKQEENIPNMTKKKSPPKKAINVDDFIETPKVEKEDVMAMFLGEDTKETPKVETPKVEEKKQEVKDEKNFSNESEEYSSLKLNVQKYIQTNRETIITFIKGKGKSKLSDCTYSELEELHNTLTSL